ncbi:hypothetical protein M407DRAFT_33184 [Tulasnella calospora MUT 4182]|uniref:Uncharacterized protein n=1 Tax=Tulasnella calospora MUT 4182 TaxID=1051891 RepID=A0A0C3Q2S2_9AGAM|nr:hypothetical protein M407DRAFT_33184 [Tulasnella calospora MUT 4182]
MSPEVPVDAAEDEEIDEITLKYQRLLPNYLLAVSPALSALHYNRMHCTKTGLDDTAESVRCPRCGHFNASTRVSIPRVGLGGPDHVEATGVPPSLGVTITRTCAVCDRQTVVSTNGDKPADGRRRLRSVRARLKGQQASSPPTTTTSGGMREQSNPEREAKKPKKPDVAKPVSSQSSSAKTPKQSSSLVHAQTNFSKKRAKGLEGLLLKSQAEQAAKSKQATSNLSDFLQSL